MFRRTVVRLITATALLAAGFWYGKETELDAQRKNRVFELRTYYANDGKLSDLQARFRNHTTKLFEKHGMTNIGYWVPQDAPGSKNTLIYLLAHESRQAAKRSWDAFRDDPAWVKVRDASEVNGKLVQKVESVFLDPTDYSQIR